MRPTEIIFEVTEACEGGYNAKALGHDIFTQGEDWDDLKEMVRDAVLCHFDGEKPPKVILGLPVGPESHSAHREDAEGETKLMESKTVGDIVVVVITVALFAIGIGLLLWHLWSSGILLMLLACLFLPELIRNHVSKPRAGE